MEAAGRLNQSFEDSTCSKPWTTRTKFWAERSASLPGRPKCALALPRWVHHWLARTALKTRAGDWWRQSYHWIGLSRYSHPQRAKSWTERSEASERGLVTEVSCCHASSSDILMPSFPTGLPCSPGGHWKHQFQVVCLWKKVLLTQQNKVWKNNFFAMTITSMFHIKDNRTFCHFFKWASMTSYRP